MPSAVSTPEVFLIAMGIILAVPYLIWRLSRCDYYAPLVVVQIIAGILLGPGILGSLFPHYYAFVFRPPVVAALNGIAWWAVTALLLMAVASSMLTVPMVAPQLRRARELIYKVA